MSKKNEILRVPLGKSDAVATGKDCTRDLLRYARFRLILNHLSRAILIGAVVLCIARGWLPLEFLLRGIELFHSFIG